MIKLVRADKTGKSVAIEPDAPTRNNGRNGKRESPAAPVRVPPYA